MEVWNNLSAPSVHDAYAAPATAPPVGELFRQALVEYSAARHPQPVAAPQIFHLVPAESSSLFKMLHGYLRGRLTRS